MTGLHPRPIFPATILFLCFSTCALADYTVIGHPSDFESRISLNATGPTGDYDPSNSTSNSQLRIGVSGGLNMRVYGNAILFFKLPILQAGETLTSANLRVTELADPTNGPPTINADLWAIGYDNRAVPPNAAADSEAYFFNGPLDANPGVGTGAARTLLQDNFLVPADVIGTGGQPVPHDTNASADASLLAYIQSLYANPNIIPGTSSLVLRLNYDDATYAPVFGTVPNHYTIASADNPANKPTLTIGTQAVPEPASILFVATTALLLARRRMQRSVP